MKLKILLLLLFNMFFINAQILFENQATQLGLNISFGNDFLGGGVSFYDYNKDGLDDVTIATGQNTECLFYRNTSTGFVQDDILISTNNAHTKQVIWVDYDNDDDLDFFAANYNEQSKLFNNNGDGTFTDVTITCGFPTGLLNNVGGSWGDYNNDGFLDVFFSVWNYTEDNYSLLYKNNGDGTFTDVTALSGLHDHGLMTFCNAFFDYNNDGFQDLYLANDKLYTYNVLYRNNGDGTFTDVSEESGTNIVINAMSTTIDDYNNDGWLDIYVSNTNVVGNVLLKNNGDGTFTNVSESTGTQVFTIAWGSVFLDGDNDADKDLYVSGMTDGSEIISAAFCENDGNDVFTIPTDAGFDADTRQSFSNAIGDVNNDGFPEILVSNNLNKDIFLWKNLCEEQNNWLKVKLVGTTSNRMGIGSWIEIKANNKVQYNYTLCGEGYISQNSAYEFFGLSDATIVDYIKVTWLSGQVDYIENVDINQALTIIEGSNPLNIENEFAFSVDIYPNPATNFITISQEYNDHLQVKISTILGEEIINTYIDTESKIDISSLKKGVYLVQIKKENQKFTKKLIIK